MPWRATPVLSRPDHDKADAAQLRQAVEAVFASWYGERDERSASGGAFTREPA